MKKITFLMAAIFAAILTTNAATPVVTTEWEFSAATSTLPAYIGTGNGCRGMGFGTFEGKKVLAVVSRTPTNSVIILDAATGSQLTTGGALNVTGITGGAIAINDGAITSDGKVLVSNVANAAGSAFKVYRWDNSTDAPTVAISYTLPDASRYGDNITVEGSIDAGTAKVYAASGAAVGGFAKVLLFKMISDPANAGKYIFDPNPTVFTDKIPTPGSVPSMIELPSGQFIHKGNGQNMIELNPNGTLTGKATPTTAVATGGASVKYFGTSGNMTFLSYFRYGSGMERADVIQFPDGDLTKAALTTNTPSLGANTNGNGAGRVIVEPAGVETYLYVLSTNNGIGKYKVSDLLSSANNANADEIQIKQFGKSIIVNGVNGVNIDLYSVTGQLVKSVQNAESISADNLKGIYIVKLSSNGKFIKSQKVSIL